MKPEGEIQPNVNTDYKYETGSRMTGPCSSQTACLPLYTTDKLTQLFRICPIGHLTNRDVTVS